MISRYRQIRAAFQVKVIAQILLMIVTFGALGWAVFVAALPAVATIVGLILLAQIAAFLTFVGTQHRKLERFLDALAFGDLSLRLSEEDWDQQLARAANDVIGTVRDARIETEAKAVYLDALVKHIPVAILAIEPDGAVALQNNAARRLLRRPNLRSLRDLKEFGGHLPKALAAMQPGQRRLLRAANDQVTLELSVSATEINLSGAGGGSRQTLLALENIHRELDDREITAWRDLIRVLTHEIMNSITPIASLARTVDSLVRKVEPASANAEAFADMHDALATISRRSEGLIRFVEGYRRITSIPQPKLVEFRLEQLFNDVRTLCLESFPGIDVKVDVTPPSLQLSADVDLLQQALINLAHNACHAVTNVADPTVELVGETVHGQVQITLRDNGCGISDEDLPQVFIPFFTTRKGGSGIGMTLARQIMSAHQATISIRSSTSGTEVKLSF